jgi:hypothetical protein
VTAGLVLVAFAAGLAIVVLLTRRDARERDNRRVEELSAELSALADPAGVSPAEIGRGSLCSLDDRLPDVLLTREQQVSAPAADVVAAYGRALERGGWQPQPPGDVRGASSFTKEVGGRRAFANVYIDGNPPTAFVEMGLDAESC